MLVLLGAICPGNGAPKFYVQAFGELVDKSLNETANGAQPKSGVALMPATGACAWLLKITASSKKVKKLSFLNNG